MPPALSTSPASLAFSATAGGASPAAKTISIANAGGGSMDWTASESASWLSVSPASGTNAGTVTVTPSVTGLSAGTYTTDVTVTAAGVAGSPKTIPVTFTVDPPAPPVLAVTPADALILGDRGRDVTGGEDVRGVKHGQWVDGLDCVGERGLDERVARERHECGHGHGDAVGRGAGSRDLHG